MTLEEHFLELGKRVPKDDEVLAAIAKAFFMAGASSAVFEIDSCGPDATDTLFRLQNELANWALDRKVPGDG